MISPLRLLFKYFNEPLIQYVFFWFPSTVFWTPALPLYQVLDLPILYSLLVYSFSSKHHLIKALLLHVLIIFIHHRLTV